MTAESDIVIVFAGDGYGLGEAISIEDANGVKSHRDWPVGDTVGVLAKVKVLHPASYTGFLLPRISDAFLELRIAS